MKVFVVIVTYNGLEWLDRSIGNLSTSTIPLEVIVVDNHSTDGTVDYILNNYPHVDCIAHKKNHGFGKANNLGISKALAEGADYVFLLNQDAWINSDSIEKLISIQVQNPSVGILSPIHLDGEGSALEYGFSMYLSEDKCPNFISDLYMDKNSLKDFYEISFVNAAAWLLSKECILQIGGFDPIFFHYGEDNNYIHRVKYHGLKVGINPKARIHHARDMQSKIATYHSMSNPYSTFRMILTNYTNINEEFVFSFLKESMYAFIKMILFTLLLKWSKATYFAALFWQHVTYYQKILKSRRTNRQKKMNYLSFQLHPTRTEVELSPEY